MAHSDTDRRCTTLPRNPNWTRDELILALDLYFRVNPSVVALSRLLNDFPVHPVRPDAARFRNPNAVYMKLGNLLRLDADCTGIGLEAGSKLDREVWESLAQDRSHLARLAEAITRIHRVLPREQLVLPDEDFPEGGILYTAHRLREAREPASGRRHRAVAPNGTSLCCEACGLSSEEPYGLQVIGFHDLTPPWELDDPFTPPLPTDLASVCANCHRVLHLNRPWVRAGQLKGLLAGPVDR